MTESETRQARKAWRQRNSDQRTTNQNQPLRTIESEVGEIDEGQLGAGQEVTRERHVHTWHVPDPDAE